MQGRARASGRGLVGTHAARNEASRLYQQRVAEPACIAPLRAAVVGLVAVNGATDEQRDRVALATSEALTNSALHAYAGRPGPVTVEAWTSDGTLTVVVSDEATGCAPASTARGSAWGSR
jgi:anti-sigma regulatory factor (Ser/Thr protein kinase)